jgi:hypothetical protein
VIDSVQEPIGKWVFKTACFNRSRIESSLKTKSDDCLSEKRHCDEHGHACDGPREGTVTRSSWEQ